MKCYNCLKQLPDGAGYCCWCGRKQTEAPGNRRPNGTGTISKRPNGKYQTTVTLGWYLVDGKLKRRTLTRSYAKKADAINAAVTLKASTRPDSRETLEQLENIYRDSKDYKALSKSQKDKLLYAWRRWEPIRFREIATLTVDELQQVLDKATETFYPAHDMKVMLSHLYELALRREIVTTNKAALLELPDAPRAKRECWTESEVQAMWQDYEAGHRFTGGILIMCYCGLRRGELTTIELANVYLKERYMIGGIKTEAGINREIPICEKVYPIIERFYQTNAMRLFECAENYFYDQYWQMVERTGIRKFPPQTCRHYYFTQLTAAGIQAGIIAETGGHASFLTTMKNYVRIPLEDKLAAVNKIK